MKTFIDKLKTMQIQDLDRMIKVQKAEILIMQRDLATMESIFKRRSDGGIPD